MIKRFGLGSLFHKAAPGPHEEEEASARVAVTTSAPDLAAELDARFREALADGEITGDIVALDEQGREVKKRKRSNIFDA